MEHVLTLGMLIFLQAVLGFDNLLYISLESKRVAEDRQSFVRRTGIGLAIALRIILLFVLVKAISMFQDPFFSPNWGFFEGEISIHSLIVLIGGVFIIYTALKEIVHMLSLHDLDQSTEGEESSVGKAITWIVTMNLIFSVDSILSAIALTDNFTIMAIAILVSGGLMIALADRVSVFLEKNRLYEVLGLFILFIVGIMLVTEGGHLAHLKFFGYSIEAMSKSTFYFVIIILVLVDMAQSRYQKKLTSQAKSTT
ncbi:MAG: tellurium resistance protein TerC [Planctomycetota bacterium]|jgi:predicted tellurium resistance membrane protein TerC|nr:tellurium resistance protein TerC [Planctomycetota bacterium]